MSVIFTVEVEREIDGRWLAEVVELPGVLAYGATDDEAIARVQALALRVVADRLENDEADRAFVEISFKAA
jgi:predicted RNase H-like HicB family nuclease